MEKKLKIIYEDKYIIAISKPSNLLTISNYKEKDKTLYRYVSEYVKKQHKTNKIYIVHRLDKDTSGLVLFAKNQEVKKILQNNWNTFKRKYVAVVEGKLDKPNTLKDYLRETKTLYTYVTKNKDKSKLAITKYIPIKYTKNYTLLDIEIFTGRKNQIRVQLSNINHPIVGDKKYNSTKNSIRRMCLHATYLEFIHPINKKTITLIDKYPIIFDNLVKD